MTDTFSQCSVKSRLVAVAVCCRTPPISDDSIYSNELFKKNVNDFVFDYVIDGCNPPLHDRQLQNEKTSTLGN
ncbi:unnamed protein product [Tenebrio molitor]|nr:unnamed protein product [Tenebrio molitor]